MYICCYILSDKDKRYSTQFSNCGCVEGDRTELLTQIKSDKNFCRKAIGIGYDFFVESLKLNTVIYIKNESDNKILGACSIYLETALIIIYGLCVPENGIKGIGSLLLDKVKCIGKLIKAEGIVITTELSVVNFYKKNGFTEYDNPDKEGDDSESMIYSFKQTSEAKGGTRKLTSQKKSKSRNKKSKKRNKKNFQKKRKTNKRK